jgi:hypothetical protein
LSVFFAEHVAGFTGRWLAPCGEKNARPDIDGQPLGIFKTFSY